MEYGKFDHFFHFYKSIVIIIIFKILGSIINILGSRYFLQF